MISKMWHNNKSKHSNVLIIMWFLFQCVVNSSSSTSVTIIPSFLGKQPVAKVDKQIKCIDKERNALLDFKALIFQDPYHCISAWGTEKEDVDDCCNWNGVLCSYVKNCHVTELYLDHCSFEGEISPSLLNLTYLTGLDLSYNHFIGTIPKSIGSLTELPSLDLSYNHFNGTISPSLLNLTHLTHLDLSGNSFSGNIPPEIGNLVNLEYLYLNELGGCSFENISSLSRLSHLQYLGMNGISLAKADHWVDAILSLQSVLFLVLDGCDLSQVMHPYSSSSSHVNSSSSSSSSSSNIFQISLKNNNLNSSMYSWLYPLTNNNHGTLSLDGNKLDEIPKYFGNLCGLMKLHLNNNFALIPFSDFLKILSAGCTSDSLVYLEASSSQFTGSISDDIQHFLSLKGLYLSHNQLNGTISEKMWELPMLEALDISSNSFRGAVSEKIGKSRILYLDLSSNDFYGPVTNVSSTLQVLNLSKNKFYGGISFLCQSVDESLVYLDLSNNSFSGQIPDCLWHLKNLQLLNLANNYLSGRLAASVEYLIRLDVLDLYNNKFSGELPFSLRNCTELTFLDLGSNRFSGNMPVWIGENLLGLYILSLGSNNLVGPIPWQFCQLVNLQILDLSMNNLNGTIPSCVNNLTSMVQQGSLLAHNRHLYPIAYSGYNHYYFDHVIVQWQGIRREFTNNLGLLKSIDLSSNNLTGKIPDELTSLRGLLALNLSRNALLGEIPQKIGEVKDLLTLDLSRNHFLGRIPSSISEMTFLNFLDMSYNHLSGKIPSSTQLQSFKASSYTGNALLCGLPLSKCGPGDEVPSPIGEADDIDELEKWFYIGGATGFSIGFWIVCITLLVISRGRRMFFHFMDTLEDWVYVKVLVFKAKFQRGAL